MTEKLVVVATIVAHEGKEEAVRDALSTLVPAAKTEPGYIRYDLHQSNEQPGEFLFYEIWENENALDVHNNTDAMKAFGARNGHLFKSVVVKRYTRIA
jgi:quinol monooxygenase YgiN